MDGDKHEPGRDSGWLWLLAIGWIGAPFVYVFFFQIVKDLLRFGWPA